MKFPKAQSRVVRRVQRLKAVVALVVFTAWGAVLGACKPDTQGRSGDAGVNGATADVRPLNVLFISSDTTRADHFGCYGHPYMRTPNVDRLSADGVTFSQCISPAPLTLVSHSSMMTGLYPPVHGVRDNGSYRLPDDRTTLAEVLRDAGYATAAEVAAMVLNREFGLNQGFSEYRDTYTPRRVEHPIPEVITYRIAEEIRLGVVDLLRTQGQHPFFIFAHFFDPHQPYEPPEPYLHQYAEKYKAEIAYMDAEVGRILDELDALGLRDNTLVLFTSDHGESLWQHGEETHGAFIYDATIHVPLILRCPGVLPIGRKVAGQVRLVDIAPTILDYLGVDGLPDAQGVSLRPLISGADTNLDLSAYSESFYPVAAFGMSQLRALRADGWKYIHAPKPELYDLRADPQEMHNLFDTESSRAARMRDQMRTLLAEAPQIATSDGARIQLSNEALANLRGLGYVAAQSDGPAEDTESELDRFDPRGADPKDHIGLITKASHVLGLMQQNGSQAEAGLRACVAEAPDPDAGFAWAFVSLAELLVKEARWEEAVEWYERALRRHPDNGQTLTGLGLALMHIGRSDDGLAMLRAAVEVEPVLAHACFALANALADKGELDEAIANYQRAIRIDSGYTVAWVAMARMYWRLGRLDDARRTYQEAIALAPTDVNTRKDFGSLLLNQHQPEEALPHLRTWAELASTNALARATVGDALRALGRNDEAVNEYRQALTLDADLVGACDALGQVLIQAGSWREAEPVLRHGLELEPEHANLANNLAWLLATAPIDNLRRGSEAVSWATLACRKTGNQNLNYLDTLAAAYAEAGRFDEAIAVLEGAETAATAAEQSALAAGFRERIERYRAGHTLRSSARP